MTAAFDSALAALRRAAVVAAPTESTFGLLADATRRDGLDGLFRLKPRVAGVALILPDRAVWPSWVDSVTPLARALADRFWPGPLTIALPAASGVDARLTVQGTVGVRVPGPSAAADLVRAFGRPLTATSANLHGEPPATTAARVRATFVEAISRGALTVLEGVCGGGPPSTIVRVQGATGSIVRDGAVPSGAIEAASRTVG